MATKRDYYDVLGVPKGASGDEIKGAYRRLARQYHPDVNKQAGAEAKFKELSEAYAILSDSGKRSQYDQFGHAASQAGPGGFGGFDFGDIDFGSAFGGGFGDVFDMFFGGRGGAARGERRREGPEGGEDLRYDFRITLEEAAKGVEKEIELFRLGHCETCKGKGAKDGSGYERCSTCQGSGQVRSSRRTPLGSFTQVTPCPTCGGVGEFLKNPCSACGGKGLAKERRRVKVQVPPGVDSDSRLRVSREGNAGPRGGPFGDLYLFIKVVPHPVFERHGDDLVMKKKISFVDAALGADVEIHTIEGEKALLKIPSGTQPGTTLRLKGKGMPRLSSRTRGDLHVQIDIEIPTHLSREQKALLQKFAGTK